MVVYLQPQRGATSPSVTTPMLCATRLCIIGEVVVTTPGTRKKWQSCEILTPVGLGMQ